MKEVSARPQPPRRLALLKLAQTDQAALLLADIEHVAAAVAVVRGGGVQTAHRGVGVVVEVAQAAAAADAVHAARAGEVGARGDGFLEERVEEEHVLVRRVVCEETGGREEGMPFWKDGADDVENPCFVGVP